jgi:HSP20 family molecular chaperone IbpA
MFDKKNCKRCGRKISKNYEFCPYCGNRLEQNEDLGILGRNDKFDFSNNELGLPIGFNTIFKSLIKNLNKQVNELNKDRRNEKQITPKKGGISISISTIGNQPPEIRVNSFNNAKFRKKENIPIEQIERTTNLPKKDLKNFSKLPREEPLTNIRRLSDKIIYEIKIPGVNSIRDISINKLESSIEIKAISKDKAYFKLIPIDMPIKDYNFKKGNLILELDSK